MITTHVLDVSIGSPGAGIQVELEFGGEFATDQASGVRAWTRLGSGTTDADGRCRALIPPDRPKERGFYRIRFGTGSYFRARGVTGFYPTVTVEFEIREPADHFHVPLLLSPFGYSTYRGS